MIDPERVCWRWADRSLMAAHGMRTPSRIPLAAPPQGLGADVRLLKHGRRRWQFSVLFFGLETMVTANFAEAPPQIIPENGAARGTLGSQDLTAGTKALHRRKTLHASIPHPGSHA